MPRPRGVAVEPQPAPGDGAPGAGLLHKAAGHQRHLVQQHPGKGDALNQACGAFVPPAEDVKLVFPSPEFYQSAGYPSAFPSTAPPALPASAKSRTTHFSAETRSSCRRAPNFCAAKAAHGPQEKAQPHSQRFPGADRPVAHDGLPVPVRDFPAPTSVSTVRCFGENAVILPRRPATPSGNRPCPSAPRPPPSPAVPAPVTGQ